MSMALDMQSDRTDSGASSPGGLNGAPLDGAQVSVLSLDLRSRGMWPACGPIAASEPG